MRDTRTQNIPTYQRIQADMRILPLLFIFLLTACTPNKMNNTVTPLPSLSFTPSAAVTPIPTATPRPVQQVEFFRIRIEYSSNSPHSLLEINGTQVLTGRIMETSGKISEEALYGDTVGKMGFFLIKPDGASLEEPVSAVIDFAIQADSVSIPFNFVVVTYKPYLAKIKVSVLNGMESVPLAEYTHTGEYDNYFVNLNKLLTLSPSSRSILRPERMVWASYYPWFPDVGWDTRLADNPLNNETSSDDRDDVALQIEQAQSAGIDGFLVSYTGEWEDDRVELLLREADKRNFKIAVYVESADNPNRRMRSIKTIRDMISHSIDIFAKHTSYAKVNGKPLFVEYMSRDIPLSDWKWAFDSLKSDGHDATHIAMGYNMGVLDSFTGFHEYFVLDLIPNPEKVYPPVRQAISNYILLADDDVPRIFAASVSPGFDAAPYEFKVGPSPFIYERNSGDTYSKYFEAAIAADVDWIFITSWNEYGENTHIEPSVRYGDQYLQITRKYVDIWKAKQK